MSPVTRSLAGRCTCTPSRNAMTSEGSIPVIDAITRPVEKSCHAFYLISVTQIHIQETYECSHHQDNHQKDYRQGQVCNRRRWLPERLPRDEAQDGGDEEDGAESAKQIAKPPDVSLRMLRRSQRLMTYLRKTFGLCGLTAFGPFCTSRLFA